MTEPSVRRAHATDLKPLAAALGDRQLLDDRLRRQRQGRGMLFVAWLGNCLAGAVYLWLEEAEEPPITRHLPGVPLIMHLAVRPHLRNQGV